MSANIPHIGTFSSVWLGVYGASSFFQISETTTDDNTLNVVVPQAFLYATKGSKQSGPATLKVDLNFLSDDPYVSKIAMGNDPQTTPYIDTPSTFTQFELLCIYPDPDAQSSIWVPRCETQKGLNELFSKTQATTQALQFTFNSLSRFRDLETGLQLFYKRTVAELAALIGPYSPV